MNKNEETSESWHSNLLNKFRNITIGAAMAESPAVMIASGWRQNNKGDYVQDQQDSEGVKQLRTIYLVFLKCLQLIQQELLYLEQAGEYSLGYRNFPRYRKC